MNPPAGSRPPGELFFVLFLALVSFVLGLVAGPWGAIGLIPLALFFWLSFRPSGAAERPGEVDDLYNRAPCGSQSLDANGRLLGINDTALSWLGYSRQELLGTSFRDLLTPASQQVFDETFPVFKERGWIKDLELDLRRKDGSLLHLLLSSIALRDAAGRYSHSRSIFIDLSERKRMQERLELTMAVAGIGTWDRDILNDRATWSENMFAMLGVPPRRGNVTPLDLIRVVIEEDRPRVLAIHEAVSAGQFKGDQYQLECRVRHPDGQVRWIEITGRLFRDADGRAVRSTGTVRDTTAQHQAADELRRARDAAEQANEAKSQFLANISHEIRTPLGGIIGMVDLLQQTAVADDQRRYLQSLVTSAETLLALVADVLDLSKIESRRLELEKIPFSCGRVVGDSAQMLEGQARGKGLALRVEIQGDLPTVIGDPGRLRQVLLNLIGNAVKFTQRGEVAVSVRRDSSSLVPEGMVRLQFAVRDTGIGIPADQLVRIFEPFAQADPSTTRVHGGTGLGLSISARLVKLMGGRLQVSSLPGQGSTFEFTLELPFDGKAIASLPAPPPPREGPRRLRLLLAEDNPVNQEVQTLLLQKAGHQVTLVTNGLQAVEAASRTEYDLILMDLQMPEMDGLRATRLIRQQEKATGRHVPIVAVTANALQGERQRCLAAGMDDYLTKPLRGPELLALIDRLLGEKGSLRSGERTQDVSEWMRPLCKMDLDRTDILQLARTFLGNLCDRLPALRQAVAANDPGAVCRLAHALVGSLRVFGVESAVESARRLEVMGESGILEGARAELERFEEEMIRLRAAMEADAARG